MRRNLRIYDSQILKLATPHWIVLQDNVTRKSGNSPLQRKHSESKMYFPNQAYIYHLLKIRIHRMNNWKQYIRRGFKKTPKGV